MQTVVIINSRLQHIVKQLKAELPVLVSLLSSVFATFRYSVQYQVIASVFLPSWQTAVKLSSAEAADRAQCAAPD